MERKFKKKEGGGCPWSHIVPVEVCFAAALSVIYPLFHDCRFAFLFSRWDLKENHTICMKISRGCFFFGCTRPRSAERNHQKDAWWFPEQDGNPLSSPRLYLLFGGDFSHGWRGRSGRSGRGGSALCSHVDVCCLRGWPRCERRGTHGRVHWSVCVPVVRCVCVWGGGAPTFFPP